MRVLIATDKFKGSLSALEASEAIGSALPADAEVEICPIADGGEGFVAALLSVTKGKVVQVQTVDALGRECVAEYALIDAGQTAVMEMSAASGLWRIEEGERDILRAHTLGTGVMMRDAIENNGVSKILLGIGGSATNDGGVGMASALGMKFLNEGGQEILSPVNFGRITELDRSHLIDLPSITVACDVTNPLFGAEGASAVFGPQKGASLEEVEELEKALHTVVAIAGGEAIADTAGAGAAGGLGWGLQHFCGATAVPGFEMIAEAIQLREKIAAADVVITGEGSLDEQSLSGKGPIGVAIMAREMGKRTIGVAGRITDEAKPYFDQSLALSDTGLPLATLIADAAPLLRKLANGIELS